MKIKPSSVLDRVKTLLKENPRLRDADTSLVSNIWYREIKNLGKNPNKISAFDFLSIHSEGRLSNSESIRRCRQKLQEEFPELRGQKYEARQNNKGNIKEDLIKNPEFYAGGTP